MQYIKRGAKIHDSSLAAFLFFMSSECSITLNRARTSRFISHNPIIYFATGPPSRVLQGQSFTISVNVSFPDSEGLQRGNFALNVSLSKDRGDIAGKELRGSLTSSLRSAMVGGRQQTAVFKDISIHEIGRHRLRILLAAASISEVTIKARLDSDFVEVQAA